MNQDSVGEAWRIPDALWERIAKVLPPEKPRPKGGRRPMPARAAMDTIFYVLRTGCQWKALPHSLGAASTVHDRFQAWRKAGVFRALWQAGLLEYDALKGIAWEWQALASAVAKAPLEGQETGPNPTDRGKSGTKRHLVTEGKGIRLAVMVSGANRHDMKMAAATLDPIVVERPEVTEDARQNLCADKGYDYPQTRQEVEARNYTPHIRQILPCHQL